MRILVTAYYIELIAKSTDPIFIEVIKHIPNIQAMRRREVYRCSLRRLPELLEIARGITGAEQIADETVRSYYEEEIRRRRVTASLLEYGPDMVSEWLWPHQCLGIELAQVNRRYNFFYDTRTGKTPMLLKVMYDRLKAGDARRCIVICPTAIVQAWLADAKRFPELKVVAYYGTVEQRLAALKAPSHIVIWAMEQVAGNLAALKALHFDCCVVDESSKMKNYKTKTAEALFDLSGTIPSWYNLSATPAPNGYHEYYVQMRCVDPYVFSEARGHFVTKYFDNSSRTTDYEKLTIKPNMYKEFMTLIKEYSIYVDQSVMQTAGKEWHPVSYSLSAATQQLYDNMRKQMAIEISGKSVVAEFAAAVRSKLSQIVSGFVIDTEMRKENAICRKLGEEQAGAEIYCTGDYRRLRMLSELLDQLGTQKVVIWANFHEEFRMLETLLGTKARYLYHGVSIADKEKYIYQEFKGGDLQYLVCHPLSVGMGINLTEAHAMVYYSLNDSWEAFKQSSERIYGHISVQPNKCHYYILLATDTVNELMYDNLINKRDTSTGLLEHLKAVGL